MLSKTRKHLLLLLIGLFAYISYQIRPDGIQLGMKDHVHFDRTEANKRVFLDKHGNEIPIFDENTLYPKPGGGYCNMTPIKEKDEYFRVFKNPTAHCKDLQKYTEKQLCMDGFKKEDNCVVLSFGINYDFKFDDQIIDRLGCQVYSFDPTMNTKKVPSVRKGGKNLFFDLGVSSFSGIKTISYINRKDVNSTVDRYGNISKMLGLTDTQIDFLKLDIEGSELDFFLDTASNHPELLSNIIQIILEFHHLEKDDVHSGNRKDTTPIDMMKIVNILHCHGFALTYSITHPRIIESTWIRA